MFRIHVNLFYAQSLHSIVNSRATNKMIDGYKFFNYRIIVLVIKNKNYKKDKYKTNANTLYAYLETCHRPIFCTDKDNKCEIFS